MKDQSEPITEEEWFLRRVRFDRFRTNKIPLISPNAFEPRVTGRDPDTDGISLYRAACLASPDEILATVAEDRRHEFGIVRIPYSLLVELNLTVRSAPDERVNGHVEIPELNARAYADNQAKAALKAMMLRLAEVASEDENILREPGTPPTP